MRNVSTSKNRTTAADTDQDEGELDGGRNLSTEKRLHALDEAWSQSAGG